MLSLLPLHNFDALIGARSEALAKEAFSRMDVHLDLNMTMIRPLDGLQQSEYLKEFGDIYKRLEKRLKPLLVNQDQWKRDKSYLWHEDRIVVPSDRVPALLKWTHESSGHGGADRTLRLFKQWFHTTWTDDQLRKTLQPIVDMKVLPWVVEGAGGLGAGKTSGAGTRGVSLDVVIGGRTGYSNTNGGESSDNRSKVHADCGPAENPSL